MKIFEIIIFGIPMRLIAEQECLLGLELFAELPAGLKQDSSPVLNQAVEQLREYLAGERHCFKLPLRMKGTVFQKQVWAELCKIPYGETISYGELARRINRPKAMRAVGMANHANPLPIIVPCHRVIGADGSLTGYGGGLELKQRLLQLEGAWKL